MSAMGLARRAVILKSVILAPLVLCSEPPSALTAEAINTLRVISARTVAKGVLPATPKKHARFAL